MKKFQQVMFLTTRDNSLRSTVEAWGEGECGLYTHRQIEQRSMEGKSTVVGMLYSANFPNYVTPLHALADGWFLITPPNPSKIGEVNVYDWWFERTIEV